MGKPRIICHKFDSYTRYLILIQDKIELDVNLPDDSCSINTTLNKKEQRIEEWDFVMPNEEIAVELCNL